MTPYDSHQASATVLNLPLPEAPAVEGIRHAPWCEVADHDEFAAVVDTEGCTSAVRTVALSGGRRAAGYLATPPAGGPVRVVLAEGPTSGDRLTLADLEAFAAFLHGLATLAGGDDPSTRYHAAVQAARAERAG